MANNLYIGSSEVSGRDREALRRHLYTVDPYASEKMGEVAAAADDECRGDDGDGDNDGDDDDGDCDVDIDGDDDDDDGGDDDDDDGDDDDDDDDDC